MVVKMLSEKCVEKCEKKFLGKRLKILLEKRMRKCLFVFLMLLVMLTPLTAGAGDALPETRRETIRIEGMDETITTTRVISDLGYSMWIDTEYLALRPECGEGIMDVYASPYSDNDFRCELAIYTSSLNEYTFEQVVENTRRTLLANNGNVDPLDDVDVFVNLRASGLYSVDYTRAIMCYFVEAETEIFHVIISCPREAVEGFGARVIWMLGSFKPYEPVSMIIHSVTPTGIALRFENNTTNAYAYGEAFALYVRDIGEWKPVEPIIEKWGFNAIGYILEPLSVSNTKTIDWEWLFGELPPGDYRIRKDVLYVRGLGDYDTIGVNGYFGV